ncbi:hypothetical protein PGT21_008084 [Puccinia graminis f. sp. tritici]|uniref:Uncharacterized protein n=1 Tax=Puccinia graminis f. sp. tritici TaxID=56615 RepID=A0A5B0QAA1_PUCGR|nr:hypothetical protein PGT21_008084 [Puccinia graminis f. sp. tritici]
MPTCEAGHLSGPEAARLVGPLRGRGHRFGGMLRAKRDLDRETLPGCLPRARLCLGSGAGPDQAQHGSIRSITAPARRRGTLPPMSHRPPAPARGDFDK